MQTWRDYHPTWEYRLKDNEYLFSRSWKNQELINAFSARKEYAGVSDLMRYEMLEEVGGFSPEADSICLRASDELWDKPDASYTVHESEVAKPDWFHLFGLRAQSSNFSYLQDEPNGEMILLH